MNRNDWIFSYQIMKKFPFSYGIRFSHALHILFWSCLHPKRWKHIAFLVYSWVSFSNAVTHIENWYQILFEFYQLVSMHQFHIIPREPHVDPGLNSSWQYICFHSKHCASFQFVTVFFSSHSLFLNRHRTLHIFNESADVCSILIVLT